MEQSPEYPHSPAKTSAMGGFRVRFDSCERPTLARQARTQLVFPPHYNFACLINNKRAATLGIV
jgi:hypothetical protein